MEDKLDKLVTLDTSHNAGYFETNDSDLELSEGEVLLSEGGGGEGYSSGEEGEKQRSRREEAKELKTKSDQFERDMDKELDDLIGDMGYPVSLLKHLKGVDTEEGDTTTAGKSEKSSHLGFYDNIYFDSDEDDPMDGGEEKRVLSNDELFYDPMADEQDEEWVNSQRMSYRNLKNTDKPDKSAGAENKPGPQSDALLSCPGCMVSLCIDCQQHVSYKNQFRAMFVMNCRVEMGETLKYKKKKKGRYRRGEGDEFVVEYDVYHPVKCSSCDTEVGVYDCEEVFHFYNVLPSEP